MGKSYFFFPRWKLVFISTYKLHVLLLSKILHSVFDCIVGLYHGLCCLLCSVFCAVVLYCAVHGRMLDFSLEWTQITNVRQNALRRCFTTFYVYYFFYCVCVGCALCGGKRRLLPYAFRLAISSSIHIYCEMELCYQVLCFVVRFEEQTYEKRNKLSSTFSILRYHWRHRLICNDE